jgi:signal peptidase I
MKSPAYPNCGAAQPAATLSAQGRPASTRPFRAALSVLFFSVLAYFLVSHYILMAVEIKGVSMMPTLLDGQRYVLYRCAYLFRAPRKSEIVVIRDPEDHGLSIKRIVGLPGETVQVRRNGVYINDQKLSEPYLVSKYVLWPRYATTRPVQVPKDCYFVLGDNRDNSADSRIYGPVPRNAVLGVVPR